MSALDYRARSHPGKLARQAQYLRSLGHDASAGEIEAALRRAGRCRICGHRLTNAESAEAGIGPECRSKK